MHVCKRVCPWFWCWWIHIESPHGVATRMSAYAWVRTISPFQAAERSRWAHMEARQRSRVNVHHTALRMSMS